MGLVNTPIQNNTQSFIRITNPHSTEGQDEFTYI